MSLTRLLVVFLLIRPVSTQTNGDPCTNYKDLSHIARNTSFTDSVSCGSDPVPGGWYRFDIDGVGQIATDCPVGNECGTGNKMWINGTLPEVDDDVVILYACVTSSKLCCPRKQAISVKKCYVGFYVYNTGNLPFCTTICLIPAKTNGDPCTSYKDLSHVARNTSFADSVPCGSDPVTGEWYRFDINGIEQVATSCPVGNRIWINGTMPNVEDGIVSLSACVKSTTPTASLCCPRAQLINVMKCPSGFFVYETGNLPPCTTVCLNDTHQDIPMSTAATSVPTQTNGDPCTTYKDLSHIARNTSFADSVPCGSDPVPRGWYRFEDNGVEKVATSCPVRDECGTGNRIWINGTMPEVADEVVSLSACVKSTRSLCCPRAQWIRVKKCSSGFFVYEIGNLPRCTTVCLNDTNQDIPMSTAATSEDTTTTIDVTTDQTTEVAMPRNATTGGEPYDTTDTSTEPVTVPLTSHLPTTSSPETTTSSVERSTNHSSTLTTSTSSPHAHSRTTKRTIRTSPTASPSKGSIFSGSSNIFSSPTVFSAIVPSETEKSEYKASTEFIIATSVGGAVVFMALVITVCVVKNRRRRW